MTKRGLLRGIGKGLRLARWFLLALIIPYGFWIACILIGLTWGPSGAVLGGALGFVWTVLYFAAAIDLWVEHSA